MGKVAFIDLVDGSGRIQLQSRADELGAGHAALVALDLGDIVGVDGAAFKSRRGELTLRVTGWTVACQEPAPAAGQVPRPRGRRDALPPSRAGPDRQPRGAGALPPARAGDRRDPALAGRARVRRGRDPRPSADLRRRPGPPVRHASQRPRPRFLSADRNRALPQALHRRRHRPRLRAGQGLPQRGHLVQAQPRVHDARVVRGLRRLRRRRRAARATGLARRASPFSGPRRSSATAPRSSSRRPGGG